MPKLVIYLTDGRRLCIDPGAVGLEREQAFHRFLTRERPFDGEWVEVNGGKRVRYDHIVTVELEP